MKRVLVLVAVLAMVTSAQGVIITNPGPGGGTIDVQITNVAVGLVSPGGTLLDVWNVTVFAPNPADNIAAMDITFVPGSSLLYQDWFMGFLPSPEIATAAAPFPPGMGPHDSHFNITTAAATPQNWNAIKRISSEDNNMGVNGAEGWGTFLDVASGVAPIIQTCDVANIAVAAGGTALLTHPATGGFSDATGERFTFPGGIVIPEPATIGLLVLGGMAVLARKRR